jgi:hypothetical protein
MWGWFLTTVLDSFLPHPHVYRADPISSSILISLAISAAVTAAQVGLSYLTAKKQKVANVDRGKVDDIRASVPGYGEFIPKGWGVFRIAPIWVWESPAVDHPVTTQGRSGGKGAPKPPTATTVDHVYLKSVAGVFHDGEIYGGVRRIWFDSDLVVNQTTSAAIGGSRLAVLSSRKYEAEHGVLSGGASVATQAECSGGRKITGIGGGGKCTISVNTSAADYELAIHYTSSSDLTYNIYVDGSLLGSLACPASGGSMIVGIATYPTPISFTAADHLIRFENAAAACPDLDCIDLALAKDTSEIDTRSFSATLDVTKIPVLNQDHSWASFNFLPDLGDGADPLGPAPGTPYQTFNLGKYGQPSIRIYRGTQTQEPDSAIVAQEGAASASAYRGFGVIVIEGIQLQGGRMPNVTLEVDQGVHSVPAIVTDIYGLAGVGAEQLNVSGLAGLNLGSSIVDAGTYAVPTYQNVTNATVGAGGAISKTSGATHAWNAHATSTASVASAVNGSVRFTASTAPVLIGFSTTAAPTLTSDVKFGVMLNLTTNPGLEAGNAVQIWNGAQSPDVGKWAAGDSFQVEIRNGRFRVYQNGIEISSFTPSVPVYPLYPVVFMYDTGAGPSALTISTAGAIGDLPSSDAGGLLLSSRKSASELLADLQTRFQFDMVEVDGGVKAIPRSSETSDITIPYTDMRAVIASPGQLPEPSQFDCEIHDIDSILLPERVDVNYLDPGLDYHNNVQSEMALADVTRYDNQSVSLSMIDQSDNMKKLAITLMHKAEMEGRTFSFQTSYKYLHVHPGTVATLTLPNATHKARITNGKYPLPAGVIEFQGVRTAASLYSPTATGSTADGYEPPIAPVPANTKGVIIDGPILRSEDAGDGTQPVVYVAMAGRGSGAWPGGFLYQEFPIGSGNYQLVTTASQASQIGVTSGTLADVVDPSIWDRDPSHALTINFYSNTTLSSELEQDLLTDPELNLLAIVNPSTNAVEYIQFQTAVAGSSVAPFVTQYTVSTFLRGRFGSDGNVSTHTAADDVVLMDSTIKPRRMSATDIGRSVTFKFVTSGQAVDDAGIVTQTLRGTSLRPLAPVNIRGIRDSEGNLLIQWTRRSRLSPGLMPGSDVPWGEESEQYEIDILNTSNVVLRTLRIDLTQAQPAVLIGNTHPEQVEGNSLNGEAVSYAFQRLDRPGAFIEARLYVSSSSFANIGLLEAQLGPRTGLTDLTLIPNYTSQLSFSASGITIAERPAGVSGVAVNKFTSGSLGAINAVRIRIVLGATGASYYWDYMGNGSVPFYRSDIPAPLPLVGQLSVVGDGEVTDAFIGYRETPSASYDIAKQIIDFGAATNPIRVRVMQISAVVGRGDYTQADL